MATGNIVPNGDVINDWFLHYNDVVDIYKNVNEYPVPDANLISAIMAQGDDDDIEEFELTSLAIGTAIATIAEVFVYGKSSAYPYHGDIEVDFHDGTDWQGEHGLTVPLVSPAWKSYEYTGLSMDLTALNAAKVRLRANVSIEKSVVTAYTIYVKITYESVGWGHKIQGVANANIGKIMGVPKANIAKVMGV